MKLNTSLSKEDLIKAIKANTDTEGNPDLKDQFFGQKKSQKNKNTFYHIEKKDKIEIHPHPTLALDSPFAIIEFKEENQIELKYKLYPVDITLLFIYTVFTLLNTHKPNLIKLALFSLAVIMSMIIFTRNQKLKKLIETLASPDQFTK